MRVLGSSMLCCLIGDPVEHSLSPPMHNAAFEHLGINAVYIPLRVPKDALAASIEIIRKSNFLGANVTMPHKESVLALLDEVDGAASRIGAVNTIAKEGDKLVGYNTDGPAALHAIASRVSKLSNKSALVLGAGGAAKAIAWLLVEHVAELHIANRTFERAKELARALSRKGVAYSHPLEREVLKQLLPKVDIVINATSVGMYPQVDETILTREYFLPHHVVFDAVYNPLLTRFLQEAKKAGVRKIIPGIEMFVLQGALAFEKWTGRRAPIELMRSVVEKELGGGSV